MKPKHFHALATAVILAAQAASAAEVKMITGKPDRELCFGIAKAGENQCAALNGAHNCAGKAKTDYDGNEVKEVAKGTCEAMKGERRPFMGPNPKMKS